ncbi:FeoA domain protein [Planctomycetes bacterium Poly30]|uniref:FeoA domain protein n=2 Tax=Saltatorellus ferox TaxID=2528018 RepID=A0A518EYH7_9BACT|nr:FeoA domain protein [Planctomycetes bacterium Poly30]
MRSNIPKPVPPFCSILELRRGTRAVVRGFEGADVEATRALARRLTAMGMPIGCEAEVLVQRRNGPILLRACGSRIALGQAEARCIRVEECSAPEHCVAPERCGHSTLDDLIPDVDSSSAVLERSDVRGEPGGR